MGRNEYKQESKVSKPEAKKIKRPYFLKSPTTKKLVK